ncbi:MAG TPA: ATP-binding protein, partial [Mucilaginibacter sp.]|nr:ATP-binding protein [Mucilaginibacter sp.]
MRSVSLTDRYILKHSLQRWGRWLTAATGIIGSLVLAGWLFNVGILKRPIPKLVAMNPVTALCFVLSSFSLFTLTRSDITRQAKNIAYAAAYLVIIIGTVKMYGVVSGINTHIDSWLFPDRIKADLLGNISNRMAPNTALAFLAVGVAILFINKTTKGGRMPSQYIALLISTIGMLSLLGYIYRVQAFYGVLKYIPMAIHTALCFLLLATAIFFAHPRRGLMAAFTSTETGATSARLLIPAAIFIPQVLGLFRLYTAWDGVFSLELGTAILILFTMIIFLIMVWFNIRELNKKEIMRREAELRIQAANKELEAFSYTVSHDLRAPLRAIQGYTQMLKEDYESTIDDEGKRIIEVVRYNTTKMGMLIDDLLAFARLGRRDIQKTVVDMNELTSDVIAELNKSMEHRAQITISELHPAYGDHNLLRQVMQNLVANALKYSSKKENPAVWITSEEKNHEIIFSVKDNGAGFDMRFADKLFGVFQRLHAQEEFDGTGIGLAIVSRIITKHGGKVWAEG